MKQFQARLTIDPQIVSALGSDKATLWRAAHGDGSDNRINADAVMDVAAYSTALGVVSAVSQFFRKAFKNRKKTAEDLAAEKEAAAINQTCVANAEMLREYLLNAMEGKLDGQALDELIESLQTVQRFARKGLLETPGNKELAQLCESVAAFTAALSGSPAEKPAPSIQVADAFGFLLEQLIRQKEHIG